MNLSKVLVSFFAGVLVTSSTNYYLSNKLEEKIRLSMEAHNKDSIVKFEGEPVVNVFTRTFELRNMTIKGEYLKELNNVDIKFTGIDYYNYYKGNNIFSDKIKVELNNLYYSDKLYTNHVVELNSKDTDLVVKLSSLSFDNTNAKKAMKQVMTVDIKNIGDAYKVITSEISNNIINGKSIDQAVLNKTTADVMKTLIVDKVNYKIENNDLLQDIVYDSMSKDYSDIKDKKYLKNKIARKIDTEYNYISADYKAIIKHFVLSDNGEIELNLTNKTNITAQSLFMNLVISKDPESKFKESYLVELK